MIRLAGLLLLIIVAASSVAAIERALQPAQVVITTDGTSATIDVSGGDVGYPGPSEVIIERDALGLVVVSRTRLFVPLDTRVYLPMVTVGSE